MYNYQSDTTQFLNEFIEQYPEEAEQRLKNRHLLWVVGLNANEHKAFASARIATHPPTYRTG